jgi:hypothetical protein
MSTLVRLSVGSFFIGYDGLVVALPKALLHLSKCLSQLTDFIL